MKKINLDLETLDLESLKIKRSQMSKIKGGTSTTLMVEVGRLASGGRCENEYEDKNGNGKFDDEDGQGTPTQVGC